MIPHRRPFVTVLFSTVLLVAGLLVPSARALAQAARWPSEAPPRPLSAKDVTFPPYELRTLDNGLQVIVVMHHEQPAVSLQLLIRAGSVHDPQGTPGVAALATSLLDQGTATRSAGEIADLIDTVGGELETGTGRDLVFTQVTVMKDSFELGLQLLSDVIRRPAFKDEEIERQRQQTLSALKVGQQDPEFVANMVFDRLVYGFHPYGFPGNGTPESVAAITRADLVGFHERYFHPNNAILAVVGDTTAEQAFGAVTRLFGDWPRRDIPAPQVLEPPPPARRVIVIDKPDAVQTEVRVGHLGVPRKTRDYMALNLATKVLGGEGANRLHRVLRMERGLTYGASAEMEALKRTGQFVAMTNTRSEATGEALRLIVDEYWRLVRDRVNERELEEAKNYMTGSFPLGIETPEDISMQILDVLFYDLPVEDLQTFRQRVNAVTVDDVSHVARQYLKPDRLAVVLVGNAAAFTEQLRGVGFGKYELVSLADLDLTRPDLKAAPRSQSQGGRGGAGVGRPFEPPAYAPGAAARAASFTVEQARGGQEAARAGDPDARKLLDRVIAAKGGLDALKGIRTIVARADTVLHAPTGDTRKAATETFIEYPGNFRVDVRFPEGDMTQVYAQGRAWVRAGGRVQEVPEPARPAFKGGVERDVLTLLRRAASGELQVRLADGGAGQAPALEISGGDMAVPVTMAVDSETGLVSSLTYTTRGPQGDEAMQERFSDYKEVSGVQFAFKASVMRNGVLMLEREVTEVNMNVPLPADTFTLPRELR